MIIAAIILVKTLFISNIVNSREICRSKWTNERGRSSPPEVFLGKGVLKICSKSTGEHPYQSVITLRHGCSVNAAYIHNIFS